MTIGRGVVVAVGVAIAVVAGVAVIGASLGRPADRTETGVVVSVQAISLTDVQGFTIRTPDGRTVVFRVGDLQNGTQFPPGHLAEHRATAAPIVVTYRDDGGEHVAIRLDDAPAASPS